MQRSLYIHLLSLLPWQGEEEALSTEKLLRCSHVSPSPWRRRAERASMTALCVRHAGRGDVMCFSPPPPTPLDTLPTHRRRCVCSLCCVTGSRRRHHPGPNAGTCRHRLSPTCLRCLFPYRERSANCATAVKSPPFSNPYNRSPSKSYTRCDAINILLFSTTDILKYYRSLVYDAVMRVTRHPQPHNHNRRPLCVSPPFLASPPSKSKPLIRSDPSPADWRPRPQCNLLKVTYWISSSLIY